jgi:hypothetical protein
VIVPEAAAGRIDLARKIHSMAGQCRCDVLYLTLVDQPDSMLAASRSMATMQAMTTDSGLRVEWELVETRSWLKRLKDIVQSGDIIVCHEEQQVVDEVMKTIPLHTFLRETLDQPVRTVSGFYNPQLVQVKQWLSSLLFWLGLFVILGGFTFLEIRLDLAIQGVTRTLLLVLVMLLEFATIVVWNSLASRWRTE